MTSRLKLLLMAVCLCSVSAFAPAETKLLEGFDHPKAVVVTKGQLTGVTDGPAVRQGRGACRMSSQAEIRLSVPVRDVVAFAGGWLRLDTHHDRGQAQPIRVTMSAGAASRTVTGYVTKGTDTLAIPVVHFVSAKDLERGEVRFRIENLSPGELAVDNLRLSTPAAAPPKAVLLDFGPGDRWPGFVAVGEEGTPSARFHSKYVYSSRSDWPDGLRGDFMGANAYHGGEDLCEMTLSNRYPQGAVVWAWLTHFGNSWHQPGSASVYVGNRPVLQRKRTAQQLLSPAGVFEGLGQSWTPQWVQKELMPQRFERVSFRLPAGSTGLRLTNVQIAAVVMVPYGRRKEGTEFVDQLGKELDAYFRQLVLPEAGHAPVPPTLDARQTRSGLVVYLPGDSAHSIPMDLADQPPLESLAVTLAPATRYTAPIVVWPVLGGASLNVRTGPFVRGKVAALPRAAVTIDWLADTTGLIGGIPAQRPWYHKTSPPRTVAGKPIVGMLSIQCPGSTRPGQYAGPITFTAREAEWVVNVTLTVVPLPAAEATGTFGVVRAKPLIGAYGPAQALLSASQRTAALQKLWQPALAYGVNALAVPGPGYDYAGKRLYDDATVGSLRSMPRKRTSGGNLVDMSETLKWVDTKNYAPGNPNFDKYFGAAAERAVVLTRAAKMGTPLIYLGYANTLDILKDRLPVAETLRGKGFRPALAVPVSLWVKLPPALRKDFLKPFQALIFNPDVNGATERIAEAAAQAPGRVMLFLHKPDRYGVGFYAWATGAAGVYFSYAVNPYPAYNPFHFTGYGLAMPTPGGRFLPTVNAYAARQGIDDYRLLWRCSALAGGAPDGELATELKRIRKTVLNAGKPDYDLALLRSKVMPPSQLDRWRERLFDLVEAASASTHRK